jgi:NAD(P)-dependent dehydrogenase (short-subunit alcohol dehydrogenase family)
MLTVSQELSKSLQSATGKLYAVKCDVAKDSDIETAFKWIKENLGGVDILVNNAGVGVTSPLIGKSPRLLLVVLMVWFLGAFTKLRKRPFVSSCASVRPHGTTRI